MISVLEKLPEFHEPKLPRSGIRDDVKMTDPVWLLDIEGNWMVGVGFDTGGWSWWESPEKHGHMLINDGIITHWQPIAPPNTTST